MRLNLGSGDLREFGWINVDLRSEIADVIADATRLPWPDNSVDELQALDLLEHFPADRTHSVLAEWRRVLVSGGRLTVKVPNLLAIADMLSRLDAVDSGGNDRVSTLLITNIYGGHRWGPDGAWDTHHAGWTPRLLARTLEAAGFDVVANDEQVNMKAIALRR